MSGTPWDSLSDDLREKILMMDADGICATNTAMRSMCMHFWTSTIAGEKQYWEQQQVPADTIRQDIPEGEPRPSGFARILDLIRRRDGVKLEEDKLPQHTTMKKAYTSLIGARDWAPHHWRPNREAFASLADLRDAFATLALATTDDGRRAVIQRYGEPEAWIVTQLTILAELAQSDFKFFWNETDFGDEDFMSQFNETDWSVGHFECHPHGLHVLQL